MYRTLLQLGISFVSVGHRGQLKAYHARLVTFDGSGGFQTKELPPPSPSQDMLFGSSPIDVVSASSSSSSSSARPASAVDVDISLSPPSLSTSFLPLRMLRMCFTHHRSFKNALMHLALLILFIVSSTNNVVFSITAQSKATLFSDTSVGFFVEYFLTSVVAQAVFECVNNAVLAYTAARTRKTLTRGLERA